MKDEAKQAIKDKKLLTKENAKKAREAE